MVFVSQFFGAAALLATAMALPMPQDSPAVIQLSNSASAAQSGSSAPASSASGSPAELYGSSPSTTGGQYGGSASSPSYPQTTGGQYGGGQYGAMSAPSPQMTQAPQYGQSNTYGSSPAYSAPSYGSGSSNWGGSGYDSCVQQCMASYSAPAYQYQPSATASSGSMGTGATHTVIVAPSQGILRYVPFALNASVGDTIQFMWGANDHTVTKSSALMPCNKTTDAPFASGSQNKSFQFTQVVNSTDPTWFYCGTPGHCQKGMFGVINPPNSVGGSNCVDTLMGQMAKNDSKMAAMWSYMNQKTQGKPEAAGWGGGMDLSNVPQWAQQDYVQNVMYTRTFLAMNQDAFKNGTVNLGTGNPLSFPNDVSSALNAASSSSSAPSASSTAATSSAASGTPSAAAAAAHNGAGSVTASKGLVILMAIVTAAFAL